MSDKKVNYTSQEKAAAKTYEGSEDKDESFYEVLNSLQFPGIDNELSRIIEDRKSMETDHYTDPDRILEVSKNLYSAMYKFGKSIDKEIKVKRFDRAASFDEIEKRGEIVSNFSTTMGQWLSNYFARSKKNIAIVEGIVEPGVACIDLKDILEDEYHYESEEELLIGPFNKVDMEDVELTNEDRRFKDRDGRPPVRKIKMRIKPPEKAKELTPEEEKDKMKKTDLFLDEDYAENAKSFIDMMYKLRSKFHDKEKAKNYIQAYYGSNMKKFIEWKEAYQAILGYEARESAIEIDSRSGVKDVEQVGYETEEEFNQKEMNNEEEFSQEEINNEEESTKEEVTEQEELSEDQGIVTQEELRKLVSQASISGLEEGSNLMAEAFKKAFKTKDDKEK